MVINNLVLLVNMNDTQGVHQPIQSDLFGDPRLPERFWIKIHINPETGCWLWQTAERSPRNYVTFHLDGKAFPGHRLAYLRLIGPIPKSLVLDHEVCGRPPCVRPDGLVPKTINQNGQRERGIMCRSRRHELTGDNVIPKPNGQQLCRACRNERRNEQRKVRGRDLYDVQTVTKRVRPGLYVTRDGLYKIKKIRDVKVKDRIGYDRQWQISRGDQPLGEFATKEDALRSVGLEY